MNKSIGMLETVGYTTALRAIDMMVKMAYVEIANIENIGSGIVATTITGDIDSVKIALEIGAEEALKSGELIGVHSIAKPLIKIKTKELE